MAKTKEQKKQEALQRKRDQIGPHRLTYLNSQWGGPDYSRIEREYGKDAAELNAREKGRLFAERLREAQVDAHGNPV